MAASAFAVDFSAGVRLQGDLFNYDDGSKKVTALEEHHENQFYHKPISFAISGDNFGGALKLADIKDDTVKTDAWSIWFKPADAFKVTVGRWSTNLNQEHIGWCNTDSGIETDGYALTFGNGAFTADIFFAAQNGNAWFTKEDGKDAAIRELFAKVNYGADFGTVNAIFNANNSFKDFRFGAGLNLAGLPVGLWFNVLGMYASESFQKIRVEADVSGSVDSLGYEVFVAGGYNIGKDPYAGGFKGVESWHVGASSKAEAAFFGMYAKLSFPIGTLGGFVEIKDGDFLADNFSMSVQPGFTTNVGSCEIKASVLATIQEKFNISVPVEFAVNF